jgi:hypothetical protein
MSPNNAWPFLRLSGANGAPSMASFVDILVRQQV